MKKIIALLLVLTLAITAFAGCSAPKDKDEGGIVVDEVGSLTQILDQINKEGDVQYAVGNTKLEVSEEGYQMDYFTGLTNDEFTKYVEEGYVSEAMIGSQAHSMVLLKLKNASDVKTVSEIMDEKIDRGKWICVGAEKSYVGTVGNYVFFVMSDAETCDSTAKAFEAYAKNYGTSLDGSGTNIG